MPSTRRGPAVDANSTASSLGSGSGSVVRQGNTTTSNGGGKHDDRGLKFGTDIVFDDAYYGGGGGDGESDFVSSLPTEEEERRMLDEESVYAREQLEVVDEGRVSNHPSTMATSSNVSVHYILFINVL
jgi:hypothetical protein